ncbi:MAG: HAD-IB family phosphatase, partial [Parachlamydiaceae bacterium]
MKTVAAFDFDGTLSKKDMLVPFSLFLNGPVFTAYAIFKIIPYLGLFFLGRKSRQQVKEKFLSFILPKSRESLEKKGEAFAHTIIPNMLKEEGLARLKWHKDRGDTTVLISANLDLFIVPIGKNLGFDYIFCSNVARPVTGKLSNINCYGEEKVRRILNAFGPKENYILYVYG